MEFISLYQTKLFVVSVTSGIGYIIGYIHQKNLKNTSRKNLPLLYTIFGLLIGGIVNKYIFV